MSNKKKIFKKRIDLKESGQRKELRAWLLFGAFILELGKRAKIASQKISAIKYPLGGLQNFTPNDGEKEQIIGLARNRMERFNKINSANIESLGELCLMSANTGEIMGKIGDVISFSDN